MISPNTPPVDTQRQASVLRQFAFALTLLALVFSLPLYSLVRFSLQSSLYSHIVLIPLISLYLVWQKRASLPSISPPHRPLAFTYFAAGLLLIGAYWLAKLQGTALAQADALALTTLSFLAFVASLCSWILGRQLLRSIAFPLAFLLFMIPLPNVVEMAIETFLQHGSAAVAHILFTLAGTTVFADGLRFQLPGIIIQVAPECSGIHSSLALFITSIVTGWLVLRSPSRRLILALFVIPLALLRNGLRVFVIGELCVHISPDMIHSYIHNNGGPIFFVLSLIPFFLLLVLLVRSERKAHIQSPSAKS
jgi:exosortase C (VPDSG-CTERM-specific)